MVFFIITLLLLKSITAPLLNFFLNLLNPYIYSTLHSKATQIKKEINSSNTERLKLSPQNEYAKWTKLNRHIEKLEKELTSTQEQIGAASQGNQKIVSSITKLVTIGVFFARFWYRNKNVYYLPDGLVPGVVEAFLGLNVLKLVKDLLKLNVISALSGSGDGAVKFGSLWLLAGVLVTGFTSIYKGLQGQGLVKPVKPVLVKK